MTVVFGAALLLSVFWAPFFGTQAVRLLRESWGGILRKDPQGDYVEQGASELAQELYSMLDDNIPQTQNAPVTMNQSNPNAPALTINDPVGGNSFTVNGGNTTILADTTNGDTITIGGGTFNTTTGGPQTFNIGGNKITIDKTGITFDGPVFNNGPVTNGGPVTNEGPVTNKDPSGGGGGGGGGTTVFLGKVLSGEGDTYQVALYGAGSAQPPTQTVSATVPQIDVLEQIPAGTWLGAVHAFAVTTGDPGNEETTITYEFQPPVWL